MSVLESVNDTKYNLTWIKFGCVKSTLWYVGVLARQGFGCRTKTPDQSSVVRSIGRVNTNLTCLLLYVNEQSAVLIIRHLAVDLSVSVTPLPRSLLQTSSCPPVLCHLQPLELMPEVI